MNARHVAFVMVIVCVVSGIALAEYKPTAHKPLAPGAIAVTKPGNLDKPGATYQLMKDIVSPRTALFLARDVTLDLNGYTVTYAGGDYSHVPNGDFEKGFAGYDVSKAPNSKVRTIGSNWPFTGKKVCVLKKGDEIVSPYVTLPVPNRSYYAMVAVFTNGTKLAIGVEDEKGNPVEYTIDRGAKQYVGCPVEVTTKLDGGVLYAHFRGKPAGKYRVRVKAVNEDAIIDHVDIRPALDTGVAVADTGVIYSHYNHVAYSGMTPCLVDYLAPKTYNRLADGVTTAKGNTKAVIRNGVIRNGTRGIYSWGVVARTTGTVVLENVKMIASGINTNQGLFHGPRAIIRNCRFETDTPFIVERHNVVNSPVTIGGDSEVSHCEFIGGQGNLHVRGTGAKVHDNLFVNRQRVTNHYSLTLSGARKVEVYNNRFEPEIGCSINAYRAKDCDIHHNTFKVNASGWSCEIYRGAGTITGVRVTDYNSPKGSKKGCWGNKVRDNVFTVKGREFRTWGKLLGRATAIFYSSGGGENYFTDNKIDVRMEGKGSYRALAVAYYIGAANYGGIFTRNTITSNVPACRIAAGYGHAANVVIKENTFIKGPGAGKDYQPIRIGYYIHMAKNIEFRSNRYVGSDFGILWGNTSTKDKKHTYSVWWTLKVKGPVNADVVITQKDGKEAFKGKIGADGTVSAELLEYRGTAAKTGREFTFEKTYASPYKVKVGAAEKTVTLDRNREIAF